MNTADIDSKVIDFLRFPLTFLVIYIHAFGGGISEQSSVGFVIYDNVRIFFSHIISRVAVPSFFVISGYLFFYKTDFFDKATYFKKITKRFRTVMIPYLIWNILYVLQMVSYTLIKERTFDFMGFLEANGGVNIFWACKLWPFRISWFGWDMPSSGPILIPLWYLRDLIVAFVLSGVIWVAIKKYGGAVLTVLFFCYISGLWPNIPGFAIGSIFYFFLGAFFSINKLSLTTSLNQKKSWFLILTVLLTLLMIYYKSDFSTIGKLLYPFYEFFSVLSTFIIAGFLVNKDSQITHIPNMIKDSSFFVYVLHTIIVLPYSKLIVDKLLPFDNPYIMTVKYLLTPCLCVMVCVGLFFLLHKTMPRFLNVLTGNRT